MRFHSENTTDCINGTLLPQICRRDGELASSERLAKASWSAC